MITTEQIMGGIKVVCDAALSGRGGSTVDVVTYIDEVPVGTPAGYPHAVLSDEGGISEIVFAPTVYGNDENRPDYYRWDYYMLPASTAGATMAALNAQRRADKDAVVHAFRNQINACLGDHNNPSADGLVFQCGQRIEWLPDTYVVEAGQTVKTQTLRIEVMKRFEAPND